MPSPAKYVYIHIFEIISFSFPLFNTDGLIHIFYYVSCFTGESILLGHNLHALKFSNFKYKFQCVLNKSI